MQAGAALRGTLEAAQHVSHTDECDLNAIGAFKFHTQVRKRHEADAPRASGLVVGRVRGNFPDRMDGIDPTLAVQHFGCSSDSCSERVLVIEGCHRKHFADVDSLHSLAAGGLPLTNPDSHRNGEGIIRGNVRWRLADYVQLIADASVAKSSVVAR